MSKQTTTLIKGLAILMMLWLHLFNDAHVGAASPLWFIGDVPVVALIARACNPVDLFIVLSGYGFRYTFFHGDVSVRSQFRRLLKLYICYWLTLIIFVGIGSFVNPSNYPGSFSKLLLNVTSLDHTYNYETWFLLPYAIVSIFAKSIFRLQNKIGNRLDDIQKQLEELSDKEDAKSDDKAELKESKNYGCQKKHQIS